MALGSVGSLLGQWKAQEGVLESRSLAWQGWGKIGKPGQRLMWKLLGNAQCPGCRNSGAMSGGSRVPGSRLPVQFWVLNGSVVCEGVAWTKKPRSSVTAWTPLKQWPQEQGSRLAVCTSGVEALWLRVGFSSSRPGSSVGAACQVPGLVLSRTPQVPGRRGTCQRRHQTEQLVSLK